jgi:hypothetical protein
LIIGKFIARKLGPAHIHHPDRGPLAKWPQRAPGHHLPPRCSSLIPARRHAAIVVDRRPPFRRPTCAPSLSSVRAHRRGEVFFLLCTNSLLPISLHHRCPTSTLHDVDTAPHTRATGLGTPPPRAASAVLRKKSQAKTRSESASQAWPRQGQRPQAVAPLGILPPP